MLRYLNNGSATGSGSGSSKVEMKDFKTVFTEIDKHEVESVLVKQVKDQLRTKLEDQTSTAIHHHPPYVIQLLLRELGAM